MRGVDSRVVTEEVFLYCLSERGGRGKLETWFFSSLAVFLSVCLCRKDEVSVWNVWVRMRRIGKGLMRKTEGYPAAILDGLITGNKPRYARHIYATTQWPHPKPLTEFPRLLSGHNQKSFQILIAPQSYDNSSGGVANPLRPAWIDHEMLLFLWAKTIPPIFIPEMFPI